MASWDVLSKSYVKIKCSYVKELKTKTKSLKIPQILNDTFDFLTQNFSHKQ